MWISWPADAPFWSAAAASSTACPKSRRAILNKKVRTGGPLRLAGLADSTGGPAFSAAAGLLAFAQQHHAAAQAQPAAIEAPSSRIGRIGSWIRENF